MKLTALIIAAAAAFFSSSLSAAVIGGYGIVDLYYGSGDIYDKDEDEDGKLRWNLRRIKFTIEDDIRDKWEYKLAFEVDAENGELEWDDAYITYEPFDNLKINVGRDKILFGLENLQSTKTLPLFERAVATDVFTPGRAPGISASYSNAYSGLEVGRYLLASEDDDYHPGSVSSIRARLFYGDEKSGLIHLGVGFNKEIVTDDNLQHDAVVIGDDIEDQLKGAKLTPDALYTRNFEMVAMLEFLTVQTEIFRQRWFFEDDNPDKVAIAPDYNGAYLQAAVCLIGEGRSYDDGKVKPDFKDGRYLEASFRANTIDLSYDDKHDYASSFEIALAYYPSKQLKLAAQYARGEVMAKNVGNIKPAKTGNAFSVRMQYMFE